MSTAMSAIVKTLPVSPKTWVIDSGASDYMVPHREWFLDYEPFSDNSPRTIYSVTGCLPTVGIGTVVIYSGKNSKATLRKVLHVPCLPVSLLSVGKGEQDGLIFEFAKEPVQFAMNMMPTSS